MWERQNFSSLGRRIMLRERIHLTDFYFTFCFCHFRNCEFILKGSAWSKFLLNPTPGWSEPNVSGASGPKLMDGFVSIAEHNLWFHQQQAVQSWSIKQPQATTFDSWFDVLVQWFTPEVMGRTPSQSSSCVSLVHRKFSMKSGCFLSLCSFSSVVVLVLEPINGVKFDHRLLHIESWPLTRTEAGEGRIENI